MNPHPLLSPSLADHSISVYRACVVGGEMREVARVDVLSHDRHDVLRYRLWSADWTPGPARWPGVAPHVNMLGIAE